MKAALLLLVTLCGVVFAVHSFAAPPTALCSVTPLGGINFGNYDVFSITPADSTGTVQILCDATAPPSMGSFQSRKTQPSPCFGISSVRA